MDKKIDAEIRHTTLIKAPIEKVFDSLTMPTELDKWLTTGAEVDARPGGSIRFVWRNWGPHHEDFENGGPIIEVERPKRLVFQWFCDTGNLEHPSTVEIDFETNEEGTLVKLRESGYLDTPTGRSALLDVASGWAEALTLLKFFVEHGISTKR